MQTATRSKEVGMAKKKFTMHFLGFMLCVILLGMTVAGWVAPQGTNLVCVTLAMGLFMAVLGIHHKGKIFGILIDQRNMMSLSRFQSVLWTIIILSAYFTIVLERVRGGDPRPLEIEINWQLWVLMGMSVTSLVGSPLILSNKRLKNAPSDSDAERAARLCGKTVDQIKATSTGVLYANPTPGDAEFTDMFEGDEVGDTCYIDISKVQMFFFTIIAAISYEVLLFKTIQTTAPGGITGFPALSDGLLAILGISHAGYLTSKTISSTKEQYEMPPGEQVNK